MTEVFEAVDEHDHRLAADLTGPLGAKAARQAALRVRVGLGAVAMLAVPSAALNTPTKSGANF